MCKWFKQMSCYILAGGEENPLEDFQMVGGTTRLENSFKNYARVFDRVKLVIKEDQAKEKYLNYPHVCDQLAENKPVVGVAAALEDADTDAVFIGRSDITDFPLKLLVNLIKSYNGESFLGYVDKDNNQKPLFGIYNKRLTDRLDISPELTLDDLLVDDARFLEIPEDIESDVLDLN